MTLTPLDLPSPSVSQFQLGPLTVHIYALCLLTGIFFGAWLGEKRALARGANREMFENTVLVAVLIGIIGARLYHVVTDHQLYFGPNAPNRPIDALKIWNGGLGIWGAVLAGALAVWFMSNKYRFDFGSFADIMAPGLIFAQGIGRLGNWFNQELFGRPTTLPWGLEIDLAHRPAGYESYATFHPTFLYELIWDVAGGFVLLWAEKRFKLGHGRLFAGYVMYYCFGRFFVESLRIDPANHVGGFRINNYVSVIVFLIGLAVFARLSRTHPGVASQPFGPAEGRSVGQPETGGIGGGDQHEIDPAADHSMAVTPTDNPEPHNRGAGDVPDA